MVVYGQIIGAITSHLTLKKSLIVCMILSSIILESENLNSRLKFTDTLHYLAHSIFWNLYIGAQIPGGLV